MSKLPTTFLDRFARGRLATRWARAAELAPTLDSAEAQALAAEAQDMRQRLDHVLHKVEGRRHAPLTGDGIARPLGSDWAWRPALWTGPVVPQGIVAAPTRAPFGQDLTLFHDCAQSELTLRQIRNPAGPAPYGLEMDVFRFDGSFLSLVLDLPEAGARGLRLGHLLRLDLDIAFERPIGVFCRFNVQHGPNTEQLVRELPLYKDETFVDFDLGYTKMNEKRIEKAWIDLIFDAPQMNRVTIRDLTLARHPRAEI